MYSIILIEDEPPILYAIEHLINTGNYGFKVTATARNGREAMQLLENNVPDAVITDISMPFMNGLNFIEEVRKSYHDIDCIILTGHVDFEYAVRALRSNVFDYLLKPIQLEQLEKTLKSLLENLNRKRVIAKQDALIKAVYFEEYDDLCFNDDSAKQYYPLILCAGHFSSDLYAQTLPGEGFWKQTEIEQITNRLTDQHCVWLLNGFSLNEKIVIVETNLTDDFNLKMISSLYMKALINKEMPIQIISGGAVQQVTGISKAIKELRNVLGKAVVFGVSRQFYEESVEMSSFFVREEFDKQSEILLHNKSVELFKKNFIPILKEWEMKQYKQDWIHILLQELTNKLIRYHQFAAISSLHDMNVSNVISSSLSYPQLLENYCNFIQIIYDQAPLSNSTSMSALEIVAYMEDYFKKNFIHPISYKMFYDLFGFNDTYLSHVFKKEKGISPNQYITKLRIDKAKEIIASQTDIQLKDIATMVGYEDAFYFSRVFKVKTGQSPMDYVKEIKGLRNKAIL